MQGAPDHNGDRVFLPAAKGFLDLRGDFFKPVKGFFLSILPCNILPSSLPCHAPYTQSQK
jgi:hypothetical protein